MEAGKIARSMPNPLFLTLDVTLFNCSFFGEYSELSFGNSLSPKQCEQKAYVDRDHECPGDCYEL